MLLNKAKRGYNLAGADCARLAGFRHALRELRRFGAEVAASRGGAVG